MVFSDSFLRFVIDAEYAVDAFPGLSMSLNDKIPEVTGELLLTDEKETIIDSYKIKISPRKSYPQNFPYVYEIGDRIKPNLDWHIYEDGHCCLTTPPEEVIICRKGYDLKWFINEMVIPFFFNQKHREVYGYFLNEREHGLEGLINYFKQLIHTDDYLQMLKVINFVMLRVKPERTDICFCGSGLKYRHCHKDTFEDLSLLNDDELKFYNELIREQGFNFFRKL